jgi:hypothetical protein
MYLIAKQQGGYQAIPIKVEDRWDFSKLLIGKREVRIILRVRGHRYLLYHTRDLVAQYPLLRIPQLTILCDEIIAKTTECIEHRDEYIDFRKIAAAAECRHQRRWRDLGLITPTTREQYLGHPIDPKTDQLVSFVRVDLDDIVIMDHEPPVDCVQEELPY